MQVNDSEVIRVCRSCGSDQLVDILDLGQQPLANALLKDKAQLSRTFSLSTAYCQSCSLFQLKETIRKEILFDNYFWVTGTSVAAKTYATTFFNRAVDVAKLSTKDFILEIASNDGTFLRQFVNSGYSVVGIEPAQNIARLAQESGVNTLCAYWDTDTAKRVLKDYKAPKLIYARNVIPHVSELHQAIKGIADALAEDGTGIIEFHDGGIIARELHYDSIYHEHLCYFTIKSMTALLNHYGLHPFHLDSSPISGGSHVIYFKKIKVQPDNTYTQALKIEENAKSNDLATWQAFAAKAVEHRSLTLAALKDFRGKTIIGFGASARSSTYLNFCGLNNNHLSAIIDNNLLKQGMFTAGSLIPIVSKEQGLSLNPDLIFVLAWNLKDEIISECKERGFKGKFLLPFPEKPYFV